MRSNKSFSSRLAALEALEHEQLVATIDWAMCRLTQDELHAFCAVMDRDTTLFGGDRLRAATTPFEHDAVLRYELLLAHTERFGERASTTPLPTGELPPEPYGEVCAFAGRIAACPHRTCWDCKGGS